MDSFVAAGYTGDPRWLFSLTRDELEALARAAHKRVERQNQAQEAPRRPGSGGGEMPRGNVRQRSLDSIPDTVAG